MESELANPAALKSKTSMGLPAATKKRPQDKKEVDNSKSKAPLAANSAVSRVDQKRKMDSKLSIVRKNAEKLKQKRKDEAYQQSSATTRAKSMYSSKGATAGAMNSSSASTT